MLSHAVQCSESGIRGHMPRPASHLPTLRIAHFHPTNQRLGPRPPGAAAKAVLHQELIRGARGIAPGPEGTALAQPAVSMVAASSRISEIRVSCLRGGLPCDGFTVPGAEPFCCSGCEAVFNLLAER